MNESAVFHGLDRKYSFEKFALDNIPAKPGVLCLAVFHEGRWLPLQFEQFYDLSIVDMNALLETCHQKHHELDASDVVVLLDIHDSNDSKSREFEVGILSNAYGLDPSSRSNIPLLASTDLENNKIKDVSVVFQGKKSQHRFRKFEPGNIPAKPGVLCLAALYESQWLPLQFEQYFDLSIVDMNALIETCSRKHSYLDASDVVVLLDIRDSDDSIGREADVINLCRANGLDPLSKSKIPLLASAKLKNSNIMDFPVIFQGRKRQYRFMKFEPGNIPAKPGVLCLAALYESQWLPLQFEQYFDLSIVDMNALIETCSRKYSYLDASDVVVLLDIRDSDDSIGREADVINLSKANGLDPLSKSKIPLLASANLESDKIMDGPVIFKGRKRQYRFMKFEPGNIPAMPGVLCLAVIYEGRWLPLQFEQYDDLSIVDMNALIETCSQRYSDLNASDVVVLLDVHDSNDSIGRESEVVNLCKANGMDPFIASTIPMQKTG